MDVRAVVTGFRGAEPLPGLPDSWHWSPAPRIDFAGVLSAGGKRLLQLSGRDSYDQDLAVSTLRFARDHEDALFARNPLLGSLDGFEPPAGHRFDAVVGIAPEVHRFYRVTRYRMLRLNHLGREPLPFLKMRYANTRTRGRSTNPGRGLTDPTRLVAELRLMDGGTGGFVEFENRHGDVWRAEWHGAWFVAE